METIKINVNDYYGIASYYSIMPEEIFDELELASLKGEECGVVNKALFDKMIVEYQEKMKKWKR